MVYIIPNCDCKTCNGGTPAPKGTFGGSICTCMCHISGHPIDSKEHSKWMTEERRRCTRETLRGLAVAEGGQKAGRKFDKEYDDSAVFPDRPIEVKSWKEEDKEAGK